MVAADVVFGFVDVGKEEEKVLLRLVKGVVIADVLDQMIPHVGTEDESLQRHYWLKKAVVSADLFSVWSSCDFL